MGEVSEFTVKKAELICSGSIYVSENLELPFPPSRSSAGPGAGRESIALAFGNTRIKIAISREPVEFSLESDGERYRILRHGETYLADVRVVPTIMHAPNQAFVNLERRCIYNCLFCASPKIGDDFKEQKETDEIVRDILEAVKREDCMSVAVTSGVRDDAGKAVDRMVEVVRMVRSRVPGVPIGVEPYVENIEEIKILHEAGATEIKINIESFDRDIFGRICPELDYERIIVMIRHAVDIFGRGKVSTNIVIGLGESDENVLEGLEYFAKLGVVPSIRMVRGNDLNYGQLKEALGDLERVTPDRLLKLAKAHKEILEKHNLTTETFKSMCHSCWCCDIVPFVDV